MYIITSGDVRAVSRDLSRRYDAEVVLKGNAAAMKLVKAFLEEAKIGAADQFMQRYATTLVPPVLVAHPTVFLPFVPGERGNALWPLADQIRVIGHEFHHVRQWRDRGVMWAVEYATKKAERARIEQEAREVDQELGFAIDRQPPSYLTLARSLRAYGLGWRHVLVAAAHLRSHEATVRRGGTSKVITRQVLATLDARGAREAVVR